MQPARSCRGLACTCHNHLASLFDSAAAVLTHPAEGLDMKEPEWDGALAAGTDHCTVIVINAHATNQRIKKSTSTW